MEVLHRHSHVNSCKHRAMLPMLPMLPMLALCKNRANFGKHDMNLTHVVLRLPVSACVVCGVLPVLPVSRWPVLGWVGLGSGLGYNVRKTEARGAGGCVRSRGGATLVQNKPKLAKINPCLSQVTPCFYTRNHHPQP